MKKNYAIAFGLSVALAASAAVAQVAPSLTSRLLGIASYYGDAQGRIPITTSAGDVKYISTSASQGVFSIYTVGDRVANSATLAACGISATGALIGCDPAYGEALAFGLEDLQSSQPDPTEMTIACQILFDSTHHCMVTWLDGSASCYLCSGGVCTKSDC